MSVAIYFFFAFIAGLAPPHRWGLRIAATLFLFHLYNTSLAPTPYDPDWGYDLRKALVIWTYAAICAGLILRWIVEAGVLGQHRSAGADKIFLSITDFVLWLAFGAWAGCMMFYALALAFQGTNGGIALHLIVVAITGVVVFLGSLILRNRWCAPLIGSGLAVIILTLDGGLLYPNLILTKANRIFPDQPRCMMLGENLQPPKSSTDLMALTVPKNTGTPSAIILLIKGDAGTTVLRWSFRARRFVTLPYHIDDRRFCRPTASAQQIE